MSNKLKLRKTIGQPIKRLEKVSSTNVPIGEQPIYVNISDASIIEAGKEGTAITEQTLDAINWREDSSLEHTALTSNIIPLGKPDITQIVTTKDGETWMVPPAGKGVGKRIIATTEDLKIGKGIPEGIYKGSVPAEAFATDGHWIGKNGVEKAGIAIDGERIGMWSAASADALVYYDSNSVSGMPVFRFDGYGKLYRGNAEALYSDSVRTVNGISIIGSGNIKLPVERDYITYHTDSSMRLIDGNGLEIGQLIHYGLGGSLVRMIFSFRECPNGLLRIRRLYGKEQLADVVIKDNILITVEGRSEENTCKVRVLNDTTMEILFESVLNERWSTIVLVPENNIYLSWHMQQKALG